LLQVLRYQDGQKYDDHWDWFEEDERKTLDMDSNNRIATVLMYLSGETGHRHRAPHECMAHTGTGWRFA
jgi:2OG-Fe(II) oxygenase superfamily